MMNWLKAYYTRMDTRLGFWKEDMKISLITTGVMLGVAYGYQKFLDWKDKEETKRNIKEAIKNNEELQEYINSED